MLAVGFPLFFVLGVIGFELMCFLCRYRCLIVAFESGVRAAIPKVSRSVPITLIDRFEQLKGGSTLIQTDVLNRFIDLIYSHLSSPSLSFSQLSQFSQSFSPPYRLFRHFFASAGIPR